MEIDATHKRAGLASSVQLIVHNFIELNLLSRFVGLSAMIIVLLSTAV